MLARHVRNRRLYDAIDQWAFWSLQTSPGCRAFYDQHRPPATYTTKPYGPSATGSSASSTAAYEPEPSTKNTPPGPTDNQHPTTSPLDEFEPWGV